MNQVRYLAKTGQNKLSQMVAKWTVWFFLQNHGSKKKCFYRIFCESYYDLQNLFHLSIEFLLIFGYRWSYSSPGCVINMNTTRWDCNQHYCYFFRHCWQYHYVTHLLPVVKPEAGLQLKSFFASNLHESADFMKFSEIEKKYMKRKL